MKQILITGGAGYIGSHVLRLLAQNPDYEITVVDNLEKGFKKPIEIISDESKAMINFVELDLRNKDEFQQLKGKTFDAVLHFAAYILVGESVEKPLKYFENNVVGSINLLDYMVKTKSKRLVFSSTSAIYKRDAKLPITEKGEVAPENPYAESKLMMEKIINWTSKAHNLNAIILRYFNPCGCSLDAKIGYSTLPSMHLMTNAVRGALGLHDFKVTCGKVDTPDGTTIRDYFNVLDLAETHEVALNALFEGHKGGTFNVGIGKGRSLKKIIQIVEEVTGVDIELKPGKPREGELPAIYCDPKKFKKEFGWKPKYTLEQAVESLVKWFKKNPEGYEY